MIVESGLSELKPSLGDGQRAYIDELVVTGFEALLRQREVSTYGRPFYAGWGLTQDALSCPHRKRILSLDALVAGTLILYPGYVDPTTRQLCNAETVVSLLEQARNQKNILTWKQHLYRCYRNLLIGRH